MTLKRLLALYVGVSVFLVSPAIMADDNDDDSDSDESASGMQVLLDKKTGEVLEGEDDSDRSAEAAAAAQGVTDSGRNVNVSSMIGQQAGPQEYHSDGTVSMKLGLDQMEYLAVTVGEDGELVYSHIETDDESVEQALNADGQGEK